MIEPTPADIESLARQLAAEHGDDGRDWKAIARSLLKLTAVTQAEQAAPADRAALLQRITKAVQDVLPMSSSLACDVVADAVVSVLPATTDRADVLREAVEEQRLALSEALGLGTGAPWDAIRERAAELRRMADEAQQPETPVCAQHPTAPVIGGMCGGCTQYPADFPRRRPPMDPVHILGIDAAEQSAAVSQPGKET